MLRGDAPLNCKCLLASSIFAQQTDQTCQRLQMLWRQLCSTAKTFDRPTIVTRERKGKSEFVMPVRGSRRATQEGAKAVSRLSRTAGIQETYAEIMMSGRLVWC